MSSIFIDTPYNNSSSPKSIFIDSEPSSNSGVAIRRERDSLFPPATAKHQASIFVDSPVLPKSQGIFRTEEPREEIRLARAASRQANAILKEARGHAPARPRVCSGSDVATDGSDGVPECTWFDGDVADDEDDGWLPEAEYKEKKAATARYHFLIDEEGLDPDDPIDRPTILAMMSIKALSFMGYASTYRALRKCRLPISLDGVRRFVSTPWLKKRQHKYGTNKKHLAAVKFYRAAYGLEADETAFTNMVIKGVAKTSGQIFAGSRGAISGEMIREMNKLPDNVIPREYKDYFILLHATGVRGNQLGRTKKAHIFPKSSDWKDGWTVVCPANHKGRCVGSTYQYEMHETRSEWARDLRRIFAAAENNGHEFLAPRWSATKANAYIKKAASILHWDEALQWVVHSIRHGAAMDCFNDGEDFLDCLMKVQKITGHISPRMLLLYSRSNAVRRLSEEAATEMRHMLRHCRGGDKAFAIIERQLKAKEAIKERGSGFVSDLRDEKKKSSMVAEKLVRGKN